MIFINFVQNPLIFYPATFADIITSVAARCQGHIIRYEVLIKIIKTSEYYIECYNQEMNGITSVIQWFVLKQRYTYRILTEHSHALSCIYKKCLPFAAIFLFQYFSFQFYEKVKQGSYWGCFIYTDKEMHDA